MISSFWLGECVWDINVMLWKNFGKEILVFDQVMRLERIGPTVDGRLPSRTGRTVRRLCADGPRSPGSGSHVQWLLEWGFMINSNCFLMLILIEIYGF
jgi:hypothetical protein